MAACRKCDGTGKDPEPSKGLTNIGLCRECKGYGKRYRIHGGACNFGTCPKHGMYSRSCWECVMEKKFSQEIVK